MIADSFLRKYIMKPLTMMTVLVAVSLALSLGGCSPRNEYPAVIDVSQGQQYESQEQPQNTYHVRNDQNEINELQNIYGQQPAPRSTTNQPNPFRTASNSYPSSVGTTSSGIPAGGKYAQPAPSMPAAPNNVTTPYHSDAWHPYAQSGSNAPIVYQVSVTDEYGQTHYPNTAAAAPSAPRSPEPAYNAPAAIAATPANYYQPAVAPSAPVSAPSRPSPTYPATTTTPSTQESPSLTPAAYPTSTAAYPSAPSPSASQPPANPQPSAESSLPTPAIAPTATTPVSTMPPSTPQPKPQPISYSSDDTLQLIQNYLEENPRDRQAQMALRLLSSVYNDKTGFVDTQALSPEDKTYIEAMTQTVHFLNMLKEQGTPPDSAQAADTLQALDKLRRQVSVHADPIISKVVICSKVEGFGSYKELSKEQLTSGRPQRVIVYCELKNVRSQCNDNGQYTTRLRAHISFYDADYNVIGTPRNADVVDKPTYNPRQDFFLRADYDLPQLPPGTYQAVVRIEDLIADKIARDARVEFTVGDMNQ